MDAEVMKTKIIFSHCPVIKSQLNITETINITHIYCEIKKQTEANQVLSNMDNVSRNQKDKVLPGSAIVSQDPCMLNVVIN